MEKRTFTYGGLNIELFNSEKYGWVTTTAILADALGVSRKTLNRVIVKYRMIEEGVVIKDDGTFLTLHIAKAHHDTSMWTIKAMSFAAMYVRTEVGKQFRDEVLTTVERLEASGFHNSKEVLDRISSLEKIVQHLVEQNALKDAQIDYLIKQNHLSEHYLDRQLASVGGKLLSSIGHKRRKGPQAY